MQCSSDDCIEYGRQVVGTILRWRECCRSCTNQTQLLVLLERFCSEQQSLEQSPQSRKRSSAKSHASTGKKKVKLNSTNSDATSTSVCQSTSTQLAKSFAPHTHQTQSGQSVVPLTTGSYDDISLSTQPLNHNPTVGGHASLSSTRSHGLHSSLSVAKSTPARRRKRAAPKDAAREAEISETSETSAISIGKLCLKVMPDQVEKTCKNFDGWPFDNSGTLQNQQHESSAVINIDLLTKNINKAQAELSQNHIIARRFSLVAAFLTNSSRSKSYKEQGSRLFKFVAESGKCSILFVLPCKYDKFIRARCPRPLLRQIVETVQGSKLLTSDEKDPQEKRKKQTEHEDCARQIVINILERTRLSTPMDGWQQHVEDQMKAAKKRLDGDDGRTEGLSSMITTFGSRGAISTTLSTPTMDPDTPRCSPNPAVFSEQGANAPGANAALTSAPCTLNPPEHTSPGFGHIDSSFLKNFPTFDKDTEKNLFDDQDPDSWFVSNNNTVQYTRIVPFDDQDPDSWFVSNESTAQNPFNDQDPDSWFVSNERTAQNPFNDQDPDSWFVSDESTAQNPSNDQDSDSWFVSNNDTVQNTRTVPFVNDEEGLPSDCSGFDEHAASQTKEIARMLEDSATFTHEGDEGMDLVGVRASQDRV